MGIKGVKPDVTLIDDVASYVKPLSSPPWQQYYSPLGPSISLPKEYFDAKPEDINHTTQTLDIQDGIAVVDSSATEIPDSIPYAADVMMGMMQMKWGLEPVEFIVNPSWWKNVAHTMGYPYHASQADAPPHVSLAKLMGVCLCFNEKLPMGVMIALHEEKQQSHHSYKHVSLVRYIVGTTQDVDLIEVLEADFRSVVAEACK